MSNLLELIRVPKGGLTPKGNVRKAARELPPVLPSRIPPKTKLTSIKPRETDPIRSQRLFDRIADIVEQFPESYRQGIWGTTVRECGSTGCIGGHAGAETGWLPMNSTCGTGDGSWLDWSLVRRCDDTEYAEVQNVAAVELGLTKAEAEVLFESLWKPKDDLTVPDALRRLGRGTRLSAITSEEWIEDNASEIATLVRQEKRRGRIRVSRRR